MIQVNGQILVQIREIYQQKKGPTKITNIDFPKDEFSRYFSLSFYIQKLPNSEQHERRWLIYSQDLHKVFCFCCKFFNLVPSAT